jgi:hypothetical protein
MSESSKRVGRVLRRAVLVATICGAVGGVVASKAEARGPYDQQCTDNGMGCESGVAAGCRISCGTVAGQPGCECEVW